MSASNSKPSKSNSQNTPWLGWNLDETDQAFNEAFIGKKNPRPRTATEDLPINQPVDTEQVLSDLNAVLEQNPVKAIGWWKANRP